MTMLYRHPEIEELRDITEESEQELEAGKVRSFLYFLMEILDVL
jgi:succinyl-CoA synthetase beta subunit